MRVAGTKPDFRPPSFNSAPVNFTALRLTIYAATVAVLILVLSASHIAAHAAEAQYLNQIQSHQGETVGVATYHPSGGTGPARITYSFDVVGLTQVFTDNGHNSNPARAELANGTYNALDPADWQVLMQTGEAAVLIVYDAQDPTKNMTQYQFDHRNAFGHGGLYIGMALVWYMFVAPVLAVFLSRESRDSFNPLIVEPSKRLKSKWWAGSLKTPNYLAGALFWLFGAVSIYGAFAWNMSDGSRLSMIPIGALLIATPWLTLNGTLRGTALVSLYFAIYCLFRPFHGVGLPAFGVLSLIGAILWRAPASNLGQSLARWNSAAKPFGN